MKYGRILSVDFEDGMQTFVTGTSAGWIKIWSLTDWEEIAQIRVINPENPKVMESINIIRDLDLERFLIGYSKRT